jgi:hypothetical protein
MKNGCARDPAINIGRRSSMSHLPLINTGLKAGGLDDFSAVAGLTAFFFLSL